MNIDNPFSPPLALLTATSSPAPLTADPGTVAALRQPYAFIAVQVVVLLCLVVAGITWQFLMQGEHLYLRIGSFLPQLLSSAVASILLNSAAILLLVHYQRERHGIRRFRPLGAMLLGYALLFILFSLGVNGSLTILRSWYRVWAMEQGNAQLWMFLFAQARGPLNLLLVCLLPLWLVLGLARSRCEWLEPGVQPSVSAWQIALSIALCFGAALFKLTAGLTNLLMPYQNGFYSLPLAQLVGCAIPFTVILMAARKRLPSRVPSFAAVRALGAALVLWVLWSTCILACAAALAVLLDYRNPAELQRYALVPTVISLIALWPLTRLSVGWFYPCRSLQSSPR